jgi:hypothetical protein
MLGSRMLPVVLVAWACLGLPGLVHSTEPEPQRQTDPRLFQPVKRPAVPTIRNPRSTIRNPIDAFLVAKLEEKGLALGAPADRLRLLRRVTFDLTGLPPRPEEQDAFLADTAPGAYERLVDRLLASPRYGERWAQHWLDLVRYAETDGFKADDHRPDAHKYRDYVIRAFNADLPYDRFVRQQLAGDELEPDNPDAVVATGFLRLWPDEYNAANLEQRRQEILDDVTETTGLAFLGMTFGCARCHDHKFDPITQADYFRLQAFFAAMQPRQATVGTAAQRCENQARLAAWEQATQEIREEMDALIAGKRDEMRRGAMQKFRPEIQQAILTPPEQRTPYQMQIALMAEPQLQRGVKDMVAKLPAVQKQRYQELEKRLAAVPVPRPAPMPTAMAIRDIGPQAPPVHRLLGGDWRKPREEMEPAFPEFLGGGRAQLRPPSGDTTGRRSAFANWLTARDNPLTARVIVNRLWQFHFGVGIVATPNDFGVQGTPATHPELLDWLAAELMDHGWSLKHLHRLMVTSAAYCQDSTVDPKNPTHAKGLAADRANTLLWHARRRRLEGEAIRDAMLLAAGDLNGRMFGPSAKPTLPAQLSKYAWKPDELPQDRNRRSIYVLVKRNLRFPLFDAFDLPDLHNSCARRQTTVTAPQALYLLNSAFTHEQALSLASRLLERHGEGDTGIIADTYRILWGRPGTEDEIRLGQRFVSRQTGLHNRSGAAGSDARKAALTDFCHAVLNSNEFLTID